MLDQTSLVEHYFCSTNAQPNCFFPVNTNEMYMLDQTCSTKLVWSSTTFARPMLNRTVFSCKYQWNVHARPNLLDQTSLVELLLLDQCSTELFFPVNTNEMYMLDQTCSTKLVWSSYFCSTNARPNCFSCTYQWNLHARPMLDQTCSTKLVWSSKFGRALLLRDQSVFPANTNGIYMLDQTCSTKLVWSSKFSRALLLHDQCSTELFFLYINSNGIYMLDQTSLVEQVWSSTAESINHGVVDWGVRWIFGFVLYLVVAVFC